MAETKYRHGLPELTRPKIGQPSASQESRRYQTDEKGTIMHTIIHRLNHSRFPDPEPSPAFRSAHYDCMDLPGALKLEIYVPGAHAQGIEITTQGPDLFVTARKTQHVRANWQTLHLESVQRDYQLKLRLGLGFDYEALQASIARGVLTIVLPKKALANASAPPRQRQVA
jgi:HSP20 family molecular chaperone IbpA